MTKRITLALLLCVFSSIAFAEPAKEGFYLAQNIQASYNPLGLQLATKLFYRLPVLNSEGMLWESNKLDLGVQNNLSPGYEFFGLFVEFEPIAFFKIAGTAQFAGYYNLLGYGFRDLASYQSEFDSNSFNSGGTRNNFGYLLSIAPTLKFAIDPIAALNTFSLTYYYAHDGKGYFFERVGNVALAKSDIELANQAYLLATVFKGFRLGVNDYVVYVPASKYLSHRIAGIGVYSIDFNDSLNLYAALLLGTFLTDRYFQYKFYIGGQVGVELKL